jgi:hypothetical protein
MLLWQEYYIRNKIPLASEDIEVENFHPHIIVREESICEHKAWMFFTQAYRSIIEIDIDLSDYNTLADQKRILFEKVPFLDANWNSWFTSEVFDYFSNEDIQSYFLNQ